MLRVAAAAALVALAVQLRPAEAATSVGVRTTVGQWGKKAMKKAVNEVDAALVEEEEDEMLFIEKAETSTKLCTYLLDLPPDMKTYLKGDHCNGDPACHKETEEHRQPAPPSQEYTCLVRIGIALF